MNRIILLVLFVFSYCVGSSQAITQRGTTAVTVQDARLFAQYNFRPPVFSDTAQANLQIGLDSCGALIFARNINAYYYRACSPKRWVAITSGGGSGNSWNIGGNASPSSPDLGTTTVSELDIITNGIARAKILATGINRSAAARNKYLMIDTTTRYLYYGDAGTTIDTTNQFVKRLDRTPGKDSIIYFVGSNRFAIKDSVGGGTTIDTTSLSNRINKKIDSLKRSSDSVYAFINGTRVFQFKDSIGGGGVLDTVYTQSPIMSITRNDSNIIFFNSDTANVWRGGVGGSGTQYFVPKWSATTTLQNSQIFDSVNVGINTTTPSYKLDVNGTGGFSSFIKAPSNGHRFGNLEINTSSNANETGQGIKIEGGDKTFQFQGSAKAVGTMFKFGAYPNDTFKTTLVNNNTGIIRINGGFRDPNTINLSGNTLWITPDYNFMRNIQSGTIVRGVYYNPNVDSISNATHIAFESTSGNVVMKGLKKSSSTTDSIAIWINDTLSKAPYPSGGSGGAVDTIFRTLGKDSIFYKKNNITYAIKDSVGTNPPPLGYYGAFSDTVTQNVDVSFPLIGVPIKFRINDITPNGISIVSNSRITIANAGVYNLQWSAQFLNPNTSEADVSVWLRKNGSDVAGSRGLVGVPKRVGGTNGHILPSWNFVVNASSNDYYEFVWNAANGDITMPYLAADANSPATASAVLTVTQQSGIMAGTGISPSDTANMLLPYLRKADTTAFQRKSIPSYTFLANNTTATANAQALSFKDTSGIYTLSPVWSTSAPTGATNHTYRWTRIGNMVTLNISLVYGTVSSNNTTLTIPLPTDCPTPVKPTGLTAASNFLYPGSCNGGNALTTAGNLSARGGLRSNATTGFEIAFSFTPNPFIFFQTTVTYYTN